MVDAAEKPTKAAKASEVVAGVADYAELPPSRVCELLAEEELARLVGGLVAGADTASHHDAVVGVCLPRRAVAELLGGISRQAVVKRDGVGLLTVRQPGRRWLLYPAFQFDGASPLNGLADVLTLLAPYDPAADGWAVALWLRTSNPSCGQRTPEEALRAGYLEVVHSAAVRQAAAWTDECP